MIQKYFDILGIKSYTTKDALKKAYRRRAKELHPDINTSPTANEEFILLNEAYEYLSNKGAGNTFIYKQRTYSNEESYQQDWEKEQKERARAKARRYAKMKREQYMNSAYYKKTEALGLILDLILNFIGLVIIMTFMGTIIIMGRWYGLLFAVFLFILTYSKWKALITSLIIKDIEEYKEAIGIIVRSYYFQKMALGVLNIVLFFYCTINTLIPPWYFLWMMILAQGTFFTINQYLKKNWYKTSKQLIIFGVAPLLFNFPFWANYTFSSDHQTETYYFHNHGSEFQNLILLEQDHYAEFPQIRTFIDANPARYHNRITYHFENGLFGFRVLKDHELHKRYK